MDTFFVDILCNKTKMEGLLYQHSYLCYMKLGCQVFLALLKVIMDARNHILSILNISNAMHVLLLLYQTTVRSVMYQ